jgi:hypothetical protein
MREKLELRTKKSAVILTACAPVALSVLPVLAISLLLLPPSFTLMILGLMIAACSLTMAFYIPSYLGSGWRARAAALPPRFREEPENVPAL